MKHFYTTKEVQEMLCLGTSRTALNRIQLMNAELQAKGYSVERGKIPVSFFHEKYPYIQKGANE
ncbi:hypothetical protein [Paenibacillus sp. DMB5]|uniref:hypothetical protein n=1 Tax=Paenibacillus sp. DMB5 TaxID=1780103 RepID=UPI00076D5EA1|nr:hypothetical protein [Paenibacillus sp. DMB5]KUP23112.1 hypothetical protein AWJ19_22810 [Paenibacillus sp. DMB5]